jgi:hypothetical protein
MKLGTLIGQVDMLLKMWGESADPEMFVELPDGSLLPITGSGCKAGGGDPMKMVFKAGEQA